MGTMKTTEEKIDALLRSVESLRQAQNVNRDEMLRKQAQLESNVRTSQDDANQRVIKRMKHERVPEFKRKGYECQYNLIEEIKDRVESASDHLSKLKPANVQDEAVVKAATEQLEAGPETLLARQKLIRIADRSELGRHVVEAYEWDEMASGDEDVKRLRGKHSPQVCRQSDQPGCRPTRAKPEPSAGCTHNAGFAASPESLRTLFQ